MKTYHSQRRHRGGFSLLEVLLATFVLVGLVVAATEITNGYIEREVAKSNAGQFRLLTRAIKTELSNTAVFDTYYAYAGTSPIRMYIDTDPDHCPNLLRQCTFGGRNIPPSRVLGNNISALSLNNSHLYMMLIPRAGSCADCKSFDIVLLDSAAQEKKMVTQTVNALGMGGGRITYTTDKSKAKLISNTQSWAVDMSQLASAAAAQDWYNALASSMQPNEAIPVNFDRVNRSDTVGDYLYRTTQSDQELNTMHAPLSMLRNNIVGVDLVSTNEVKLNGGLHLQGTGTTVGGLNVNNGEILVSKATSGGAATPGQVAMNATGQLSLTGGGSVLTKGDILVKDQLVVDSAGALRAQQLKINNGSELTVSKVGVYGKTVATKLDAPGANLYAQSVDMTSAGGSLQANKLIASELKDGEVTLNPTLVDATVGSATTNTGGIKNLTTDTLSGQRTVNGKSGGVDSILLNGSLKLGQFGDCGVDCQ